MTLRLAHLQFTQDQARARVADWLRAEHGVQEDARILEVATYVVPLLAVRCDWTAHWRGFGGTPDAAAFEAAKARHAAEQDGTAPRASLWKKPAEPRAEQFVAWRRMEGDLAGSAEWGSVFDGDIPARGFPLPFKSWCSRIGQDLALGEADLTTDLGAWKARAAGPARMLPAHDPRTIFSRLHVEIHDRIREALTAELPPLNRGVSFVHKDSGDGEKWRVTLTTMLPVHLIRYTVRGATCHALVDGVSGTAWAGDTPPRHDRRERAAWTLGAVLVPAAAAVLAAFVIWGKASDPPAAPPVLDRSDTAALSRSLDTRRGALEEEELRQAARRMATVMCVSTVAGSMIDRATGEGILAREYPRLSQLFLSCQACNTSITGAATEATFRVFSLFARSTLPAREEALAQIEQTCTRQLSDWEPVVR